MSTESTTEKRKWPAALGWQIGRTLVEMMRPYVQVETARGDSRPTSYIAVAGSLRRGKEEVGDVEILYVPRFGPIKKYGEMFESTGSLADNYINSLVGSKLEKRLNVEGHTTWGNQNKLAVHKATGMPVDLFATTVENWWVSLVIRTGPKDFNIALIQSARNRGLQLNAYGTFTELATGDRLYPESEREVFDMAGMAWVEPEDRK
jgi:DNA polymerase/3'-5' exonuclease PolX